LLFIAGLSRSMEFTALNTLAFADINRRTEKFGLDAVEHAAAGVDAARRGDCRRRSQRFGAFRGLGDPGLIDFRWAFVVIGIIGIISSLRFLQLGADAGAEVSGHKFER
jgi:hypothetical protein